MTGAGSANKTKGLHRANGQALFNSTSKNKTPEFTMNVIKNHLPATLVNLPFPTSGAGSTRTTSVMPPKVLARLSGSEQRLIATIVSAGIHVTTWATLPDALMDRPVNDPRRALAKRRMQEQRDGHLPWEQVAASCLLLIGYPSGVVLRSILPLLMTQDNEGRTELDDALCEAATELDALTPQQRWELLARVIVRETLGNWGDVFDEERGLMAAHGDSSMDADEALGALTPDQQNCIADIIARTNQLRPAERPALPAAILALPAGDPRRVLAVQRLDEESKGVGPALSCASLLLLSGLPSTDLLRLMLPLLYIFENYRREPDFYQAIVGTNNIEALTPEQGWELLAQAIEAELVLGRSGGRVETDSGWMDAAEFNRERAVMGLPLKYIPVMAGVVSPADRQARGAKP